MEIFQSNEPLIGPPDLAPLKDLYKTNIKEIGRHYGIMSASDKIDQQQVDTLGADHDKLVKEILDDDEELG